jgi:5-methylcytosine-specific restriction endonuclease McrA
MGVKRSSIWLLPSDEFKELVYKSESITEILNFFGKLNKGGNFRTLKERCVYEGIPEKDIPKQKIIPKNTSKPLKDILVKNSNYNRGSLKKRLINENILKYECGECDLKDTWNDKKITLQLDHINGISNDHRLENLRFLCPNCHSQTSNFAGRNKYKENKKYLCLGCGCEVSKRAKRCYVCHNKRPKNNRKVPNRPSLEQLEKDLETMSYVAVGKKYGVSDNCIRKWLKAYQK